MLLLQKDCSPNYFPDEQIAQLYELMQAIRKQELEENDPEYTPEQK
jgi:hypothetical protein